MSHLMSTLMSGDPFKFDYKYSLGVCAYFRDQIKIRLILCQEGFLFYHVFAANIVIAVVLCLWNRYKDKYRS